MSGQSPSGRAPSDPAPSGPERETLLVVVAALIVSEGRILACRRRKGDAFELKWEFPGGKVAPGESPQAALARELQEELGVGASVGKEIYRTRHRYAGMCREIELMFFAVQADPSAMRNLAFDQIAWVPLADLSSLDFLPADRELIGLLSSGRLAAALRDQEKTSS